MSEDGRFAIVVIALLGNPFSPAYARQRLLAERAGTKSPAALSFSSLNVALYGPDRKLWALTETAIGEDARTSTGVRIGRSAMQWTNDELRVDVDETCAPLGRRIRGTVRILPECEPGVGIALDPRGAHMWWPVAPLSRIEVALDDPGIRFSGHGYHDANAGDEPLPAAFSRWTWSRARLKNKSIVTYDTELCSGRRMGRALAISSRGDVTELLDLPAGPLPTTRWGLPRSGRGDGPTVRRSLEDTPFYARAMIESEYQGERVVAMHEELSCERLSAAWVRFLLGFRMRRRAA